MFNIEKTQIEFEMSKIMHTKETKENESQNKTDDVEFVLCAVQLMGNVVETNSIINLLSSCL